MIPKIHQLSKLRNSIFDFNHENKEPCVWIFDIPIAQWHILKSENNNNHSKLYLKNRNKHWRRIKKTFGDILWNSKVVTIDYLEISNKTVTLKLNTCEYKDILYKNKYAHHKIRKKHLSNNIPVHSFTAIIPITDSGKVVLGVVGNGTIQTPHTIDLIGGTLNPQEHPINSFRDIKLTTIMELYEETGTKVTEDEIHLISINYYYRCCFYLFLTSVNENEMQQNFNGNHEVSNLIYLSINELKEIKKPITKDLLFVVNYIQKAMELFDNMKLTN